MIHKKYDSMRVVLFNFVAFQLCYTKFRKGVATMSLGESEG